MTDAEAKAYNEKWPHIHILTVAFNSGRSSVEDDGSVCECGFTSPELVAEWKAGVRSMRSEIRLNNDTEWD